MAASVFFIEWALALALVAPHVLYAFIWFFPSVWRSWFGKRSVTVFDSAAWGLKGDLCCRSIVAQVYIAYSAHVDQPKTMHGGCAESAWLLLGANLRQAIGDCSDPVRHDGGMVAPRESASAGD